MSDDLYLISADSHTVEPPDLFTSRIEPKYRDVAPRIERRENGDYLLVKDMQPRPLGFEGAMMNEVAGKQGTVTKWRGFRFEENRPGGWDVAERLKDQDADGVSAEVVYTGQGIQWLNAPDSEYVFACARVYNDWVAELASAAPDRLAPIAALPAHGAIEWAVAEVERAATMGHRGVMLLDYYPDRPWNLPEWNPLWAACQEARLPVSLHAGGRSPFSFGRGPGAGGINGTLSKCSPIYALPELIWGGVPQHFPHLQIVLVEGGLGWVAHIVGYMDHWWKMHRSWQNPRLEEPPSFYFARNFWVTFEDDRAGILTRELLNVDHLLWGSDYPHVEGVWPRSRQQIAHDFAGVPREETQKIVALNCARLYGFPVPAALQMA